MAELFVTERKICLPQAALLTAGIGIDSRSGLAPGRRMIGLMFMGSPPRHRTAIPAELLVKRDLTPTAPNLWRFGAWISRTPAGRSCATFQVWDRRAVPRSGRLRRACAPRICRVGGGYPPNRRERGVMISWSRRRYEMSCKQKIRPCGRFRAALLAAGIALGGSSRRVSCTELPMDLFMSRRQSRL